MKKKIFIAFLSIAVLATILSSIVLAAVALGTNAGFVASAPVADPDGSNAIRDSQAVAQKHTTPAGATTITEVGWWCDTATEAANFEVGIYDHNSTSDAPFTLLYSEKTNAKGTDAGWKVRSGLNWSISGSTIYWIAFQLDGTATSTNTNFTATGSTRSSRDSGASTLDDPTWNPAHVESATNTFAVYAVYTTADGTNITVLLPLDKQGEKSNFKNGGKQ